MHVNRLYHLSQDLSFLRELQEFYPDINVFFVKVPDCSPSRSQCNCRHGHDHNFQSSNGITDDEANYSDASPRINSDIIFDAQPTKPNDVECVDKTQSPDTNRNSSHIIFDAHPTNLNDVECGDKTSLDVFQQLLCLGFLSALPLSPPSPSSSKLAQTLTESGESSLAADGELVEDFDQFPDAVATFTHQVLERHLLRVTNLLHLVHTRTLETFILAAFDMSRDILVTPRKLEFAREREAELYESLMQMALLKQNEIQDMIAVTISGMREELLTKATSYDFIGIHVPKLCH